MKVTKSYIKQLVKEELNKMLSEAAHHIGPSNTHDISPEEKQKEFARIESFAERLKQNVKDKADPNVFLFRAGLNLGQSPLSNFHATMKKRGYNYNTLADQYQNILIPAIEEAGAYLESAYGKDPSYQSLMKQIRFIVDQFKALKD